MRINKLYVTTAIALLLGFALGALVFRRDSVSRPGDADQKVGVKNEIWTCSMHPSVKSPKPGLCPICAMELIPLSTMGASGGARDYSMSEAAKKLAGITTVPVIRRSPHAEVNLFGKVAYDESRRQSVSARFDSRIEKLFINYTGIPVIKGDHLALVYSPDLLTAQSELISAKKFDNQNSIRLAREKLRLWGFSKDRIEQIESTGKVIDQMTVDAPASGIVTHLNVNEGDYVKTGTRFFQIADTSRVWVLLQAYESDLPWLRYGQKVVFTVQSFPGREFEGVISFIPPDLDPRTRTISIRVNVANPEKLLKPGMFVRGLVKARVSGSGKVMDPSLSGKWISPMHPEVVKDGPGQCDVCGMDLVRAEELGYAGLSNEQANLPLLVPAGAVLHTGKRSIVYVEMPDREEPTFEGRDILLGPKTGEFYIVEAGIEEGEQVVAEGGFVIDSALQIQAKNSMMLPGERKPLYRKISVPDQFLSATDRVLQNYFAIQSGLANDSLETAQEAAKQGSLALETTPTDLDISSDAIEVWSKLSEKFKTSFNSITQTKGIEAARIEFKRLTELVNETVLRFGTEHLPVFEMHCPMAFDNAGASWFQSDKELLNPYFGSKMLHCGTIEKTLSKGKPFPVPGELNKQIESIIKAYFLIARDLSDDNNQGVQTKARELKQLFATFNKDKFTHPQSSGVWSPLADTLSQKLEDMKNQDSIGINRAHFKSLSEGIKSIVTQFGGAISFKVNEAHCPMAFNKEGGNWLLESDDILNPYFGAKMLKCGDIVETIHLPVE